MSDRTATLRRRLGTLLGLVAVSALSLEVAARVFLHAFVHQAPSEVRQHLEQVPPPPETGDLEGQAPEVPWVQTKVLHPYLGFVLTPDHEGWLSRHINEFGFHGEPVPEGGDADQIVIAVTGGSVAMGFFVHVRTNDGFLSRLRRQPAFADRKILIVSLAVDGMKQPQQLMALNYFLSLGRRVDYVVNLDGFNEVVLPYADNVARGVFPFYPRGWQWYAAGAVDPARAIVFGRIAESRRRGHLLQRRLAGSPLRHTALCLAAWHVLESRRIRREAEWEERLAGERPPEALGFQERGPGYSARDLPTVVADGVGMWKRSSLLMQRLCDASGIRYLHVLQPNQYLENSKPLSEEERRVAIGPARYGYRRAATEGFPLLRGAGRELAASGVAFEDLTDVFADVTEPVYVDTCCHVNPLGNVLMARRIADRLGRLTRDGP